MTAHRRGAELKAVLVYADEPQLLAMRSGKSIVVAVAVPDEDDNAAKFLATTVSQKDWEAYFDETVDLRYLFTFPTQRLRYTFDLHNLVGSKVMMEPFDQEIPERYLPAPRFFSSNHTEEFDELELAAGTETLLVDGSWDMPEFGRFYQRYADVYSFLVAILNWSGVEASQDVRKKVEDAFASKPFKGGSSYRHFYRDLIANLARDERLGLQEIQYASPGHVDVHGREDAFEDVQGVIRWYMAHRAEVQKKHSVLRSYLSNLGLLQLAGSSFATSDDRSGYILKSAEELNMAMHGPDFQAIRELSKHNALVAAKIVLSFYRRVNDAAEFFSQGRVNFS